jgi:hypothetical protein
MEEDDRMVDVDGGDTLFLTQKARNGLGGKRGGGDDVAVVDELERAEVSTIDAILAKMRKAEATATNGEEGVTDQGNEDVETEILVAKKRGRGRPRKNVERETDGVSKGNVKRGRGRPRKTEILE